LQLNQAFARDSILITVGDNVAIDRLVTISHTFTECSKSVISGPQIFGFMGKASSLSLLECFQGENPGFFIVQNRFNIGAEASLMHYKLQELGSENFLIYNNLAEQQSSSSYTHFNIDLGGRVVRNNISAIHRGSNLVSNLFGVFPGTGEQHVDTQSLIDHAMPHCESHELYRQVLKDKSRGVFNGKVMVRQDAQKTNAYQQNDTILVSDTARMDSKPQLEIFADDVRCSHGATIGQLDENAIFYLKSRGLNDSEARFLLEWAFINEVLEKIEQEEVREFLSDRVRYKVLSK
jgi:Fe-S cluster assembly protein SufD